MAAKLDGSSYRSGTEGSHKEAGRTIQTYLEDDKAYRDEKE